MVRLSIEKDLWSDPRFHRLIEIAGNRHLATGYIVGLWALAQFHWIPKRELIPFSQWEAQGLPEVLIALGFAERRESGIYAEGTEERFAWWFEGIEQRREAGRTGGRVSALRPRDERGRLLPKRNPSENQAGVQAEAQAEAQADPSNFQADKKETQAIIQAEAKRDPNDIQTETKPSFLSPLKEEIHIAQRKRRAGDREEKYDLEAVYQKYPRRIGKTRGIKKLRKEIQNEEDYQDLIKAIENYAKYVSGKELEYVKHFSTFVGEWREWIKPPVEEDQKLLPSPPRRIWNFGGAA